MTRIDTQCAKGLSILLMLFLHLFNHYDNYVSALTIQGKPLELIVSAACNPVSFYLILGGVGLYSVWSNGKGTFHDNSKRILRLFSHYWVILLIFVFIGHLILPERYPGSLSAIIENLTAFHTTYNGECWFLFPYALVALSSPILFRMLNKYDWRLILLSTFVIGIGTSFLISRYGEKYLFGNMIVYNPLLYFHLLFSFLLGAVMVKTKMIDRFLDGIKGFFCGRYSYLIWLVCIVIFSLPCIVRIRVGYAFYASALIIFFVAAPKWNWVEKTFTVLGKHSMNMWMIHTWFAYYLFHDAIYSLKYPPIIFGSLVILSLVSSLVVNYIVRLPEKLNIIFKQH